MENYLTVLRAIDGWFASILAKYAHQMQCRRGCALCCDGLFDISLPDAMLVAEAMNALSRVVRDEVCGRAAATNPVITGQAELAPPNFLHGLAEARRRLRIQAGTRLQFVIRDDGRLEVIPLAGSVRDLKGAVPRPKKVLSLTDMDAAIAGGSRR